MTELTTEQAQLKYIEWLTTSEEDRELFGMPASKQSFAASIGKDPRRLREWEKAAKWQSMVDEYQLASKRTQVLPVVPVSALPNAGVPELSASIFSDDRQAHEAIKQVTIQKALDGNKDAQSLWFRTYGNNLVAEDIASRVVDLASYSDDELVADLLATVLPEQLAAYLTSLGWSVSGPEKVNG